ncbi:MAG: hypothetical protein ACFCGT_15050 [Sandaracinaceae bacterium]
MAIPEFLLDRRVVERYVRKGLVDQAGVSDALASLEDAADNAEACLKEEEDGPDEGDE